MKHADFIDFDELECHNEDDGQFARAIVSKIDLSRWPYILQVSVIPQAVGCEGESVPRFSVMVLAITARVKDRDSGEPFDILMSPHTLPARMLMNDDDYEKVILAASRRALIAFLTHELDENMQYEGKRPFDAHASEIGP